MKVTKVEPAPTFTAGQIVQVRCGAWRPAYMRDDWCMVQLPGLSKRAVHVSKTRPGDKPDTVWMRAKVVRDYVRSQVLVECSFLDVDGEGTLGGIFRHEVRPYGGSRA